MKSNQKLSIMFWLFKAKVAKDGRAPHAQTPKEKVKISEKGWINQLFILPPNYWDKNKDQLTGQLTPAEFETIKSYKFTHVRPAMNAAVLVVMQKKMTMQAFAERMSKLVVEKWLPIPMVNGRKDRTIGRSSAWLMRRTKTGLKAQNGSKPILWSRLKK